MDAFCDKCEISMLMHEGEDDCDGAIQRIERLERLERQMFNPFLR